MLANRAKGNHLITVATEHKAVLETAQQLAREGFEVTILPVDSCGLLRFADLEEALKPSTVVVSVMYANNEIGVIQDVRAIGEVCRRAGVYFHSDAAQAVSKVPVDVQADKIDLLSLSGHKICGPKGIGAIYVRRRKPRVKIQPLMFGGGHERGLRSGTANSPGIIGLGAACALGARDIARRATRLRALREDMWDRLQQAIPGVVLNGAAEPRLPGNLNFRIPGVDAEALIYRLENIAISSGAACTATKIEPSHVLLSLGLTEQEALSSLRIGMADSLDYPDLIQAVAAISSAYAQLRALISIS